MDRETNPLRHTTVTPYVPGDALAGTVIKTGRRKQVTNNSVKRSTTAENANTHEVKAWAFLDGVLGGFTDKLDREAATSRRKKAREQPAAPLVAPPTVDATEIKRTRFIELDDSHGLQTPTDVPALAWLVGGRHIVGLNVLMCRDLSCRPSLPAPGDVDMNTFHVFQNRFDVESQGPVQHKWVVCSCRSKGSKGAAMTYTCGMCRVVYCASCVNNSCVVCKYYAGDFLHYVDTTRPAPPSLLSPAPPFEPLPAIVQEEEVVVDIPLQRSKTLKPNPTRQGKKRKAEGSETSRTDGKE